MIKIKVAVISDIHGNIVALDAILKECKNENIDEYIFSGDLINDLPFGNETLDVIRNLTNKVVRGNKEDYITEYDKQKFKWENIQFKNTIFMYNSLRKDNLDYVNNLPLTLSLKFENIKILVCHGSPESVEEQIHIDSFDKIEKYTKKLNEDVLIFGHTHDKIWYEKYNDKLIINAGCAGVSPHNGEYAEYIILEIEGNNIIIHKKIVKFDVEKLKELIKESGILNEEKVLMNLTYGAIIGKGLIRYNFFKEAKSLMIKRNKALYREDATGIYKYFKLYDDDIWLGLYEKYINEFELF